MPTPHLESKEGDIAEVCLLPGDPKRAKYIAEKFLEDVVQVNGVRNMLAFTGKFNGHRVSVVSTGMGIPSCSIYVTELVRFYGVKKLIRVGSCGTPCAPDVKTGDVILAIGAGTDSQHNKFRFHPHYESAACADFELLRIADLMAKEAKLTYHVGKVFSSDLFYRSGADEIAFPDVLEKFGYLGIEMEASALYSIASEYGCQALTICTVSDELNRVDVNGRRTISYKGMSSDERERTLNSMIDLALKTVEMSLKAKKD